jgi:heptosyltransferase-3
LTLFQKLRIRERRLIKDLRWRGRRALGHLSARLVGPRQFQDSLSPDDVSSILIVRINRRIGNSMFLTPLIRMLHELLPHAAIDLLLANAHAAELLGKLPGVRNTIVVPKKVLVPRLHLAAVRQLRSIRYDLAIDPVPESTSGRIALALTRARYRLGFANRSQWAPLTHAVADAPELATTHEAARAVLLASRVFDVPFDAARVRLWLPLQDAELSRGREALRQAVGARGDLDRNHIVGFFSHAAAFKALDNSWWQTFWSEFLQLEPGALPVEFLPSANAPRVDERFPALHLRSLRDLTAAISATRMFVSTDTGPMHLASSTAVPTVALFRASNPTLYRPLKPADVALDLSVCDPREAARRSQLVWRSQRARIGIVSTGTEIESDTPAETAVPLSA